MSWHIPFLFYFLWSQYVWKISPMVLSGTGIVFLFILFLNVSTTSIIVLARHKIMFFFLSEFWSFVSFKELVHVIWVIKSIDTELFLACPSSAQSISSDAPTLIPVFPLRVFSISLPSCLSLLLVFFFLNNFWFLWLFLFCENSYCDRL